MKPETAEWIEKAEGDWRVLRREVQAVDPVWNVVCYLAQQCAEKYLKAYSEEQGLPYGKIHDLVVLCGSTEGLLPELEGKRDALARPTAFGVAARYPGLQADASAAKDATGTAEIVRGAVRARLGCN